SGAEEWPVFDQYYNFWTFNYKAVGGGVYVSADPNAYSSIAHTGSKSVQASAGERGFTYFFVPKISNYQVSFWSSQPNTKVRYRFDNGAPQDLVTTFRQAGTWFQVNATLSVPSNYGRLEIWCEANGTSTLFDDFRVHPVDAAMTSYVYNNWGELTHILDNNNLYTQYVYDEMGRLKETYKESFQTAYGNQGIVKVSDFKINYAAKNPGYTVPIETVAGAGGTITPSQMIPQGADAIIRATSNCQNLGYKFFVDGKPMNAFAAPTILYDQAKAYLVGTALKIAGVLGNHTVRVEFETPGLPSRGPHFVECEFEENGHLWCPTGQSLYFVWDVSCGA
ncbi:MAG: hypothetical protein ACKOE6_15135, partial [Flammeovirgaceae bacterium]